MAFMQRRRLFFIGIASIGFMAILGLKVFVLSVFPDLAAGGAHHRWQDVLPAKADLEHFESLMVDDARGRILFRTGQPWSGESRRVRWRHETPLRIHTERTAKPQNPVIGEVGLPDKWPDDQRAIPEQGRSGLEWTFDRILQSIRPEYIATFHPRETVDAPNRQPSAYFMPPVAGADIRTTVDPAWQHAAEDALTKQRIRQGAVVVLDVKTNEALAIAGRDADHPFVIPALRAETPGSVFKLLTAATALESYRFLPGSRFYCSGLARIPGVSMRCWRTHGRETLEQALAESCDVAFADIGITVGRKALEEMWQRLALDSSNLQTIDGQSVLPAADIGALFQHRGNDNGLLANTAIGQEDVRLTPVQAANLARTIAAGGKWRPVRLVLDAEKSGTLLRDFPTPPDNRVLASSTVYWLSQGMEEAVTSPRGTAHGVFTQSVPVAVKTGTAEVTKPLAGTGGRQVVNGQNVVNGWMVGFFPFNHPQIAFSVYVGQAPSSTAHRATREITKSLLRTYRQFQGPAVIG